MEVLMSSSLKMYSYKYQNVLYHSDIALIKYTDTKQHEAIQSK